MTRKYTKTHEWISADGATRRIGITDFAQQQLGDIVFVELPAVGKPIEAGEELGVIESTKATASYYSPVSGKVAAVNPKLEAQPELVNSSPDGDGWLVELAIKEDNPVLLDEAEYQAFCAEEH